LGALGEKKESEKREGEKHGISQKGQGSPYWTRRRKGKDLPLFNESSRTGGGKGGKKDEKKKQERKKQRLLLAVSLPGSTAGGGGAGREKADIGLTGKNNSDVLRGREGGGKKLGGGGGRETERSKFVLDLPYVTTPKGRTGKGLG